MDTLGESLISEKYIEPKEEQRELFPSREDSLRCSSLCFITNTNSENVALDYLAKVLVEAFLDEQEYERNKSNKS